MIRKITIKRDQAPHGHKRCIGCEKPVSTGFAYEGTMITGVGFKTVEGIQTVPIKAVITTWERSYVVGGEEIRTQKKVAFLTRKQGTICSDCAGNWRQVQDASGKWHPVVKLKGRERSSQTILPVREI